MSDLTRVPNNKTPSLANRFERPDTMNSYESNQSNQSNRFIKNDSMEIMIIEPINTIKTIKTITTVVLLSIPVCLRKICNSCPLVQWHH